MDNSILVIDDEPFFLTSVRRGLRINGFKSVTTVDDPCRAVDLMKQGNCFDLVLIDVTMPAMSGVEMLGFIKDTSPDTECIMVTAVNEARIAMECLKKGAYDYLIKPVTNDDLVQAIKRALERKRLLDIVDLAKRKTLPKLRNPEAFDGILTNSEKMLRILKEAELHAASHVPVLITGESGTGKEMIARAIHSSSPRSDAPFMPVNMAALTPTLFDAEFFGHTKGAFTGAEKDRRGYLEHAHHGSLFLDEIGNLPMELQGKLLRVLQEGEYIKIGSNRPMASDIRFIAATNEDLEAMISKGFFRKDLFYRLRGAWLHLPPLRERKEDIPLLVKGFLQEISNDPNACTVGEDALSILMAYEYPGNIRELKSIIQTAANLSSNGSITGQCIPSFIPRSSKAQSLPEDNQTSPMTLSEVEKAHILRTYKGVHSNKSKAARILGISLNTLRKKLASYSEK